MAALRFAKLESNLHSARKIRKAGRAGREVFIFALLRNADREHDGRVPCDDLDPEYMADMLMMPVAEAEAGLSACLATKLLEKVGDDIFWIVGWGPEWGKHPLSGRDRTRMWREKQRVRDEYSDARDSSKVTVTPVTQERRGEEKREDLEHDPRSQSIPSMPVDNFDRDKLAQLHGNASRASFDLGVGDSAQEPSNVAPGASHGPRIERQTPLPKPKPTLPDEAFTMAHLLMGYVVQIAPDSRMAKKSDAEREKIIERWAEPIEKLNRIDKQTWGAIEATIHWVAKDRFWRAVILGGDNLRDKWDKIQAQRNRGAKPDNRANPTRAALADVERLEREEQEALRKAANA